MQQKYKHLYYSFLLTILIWVAIFFIARHSDWSFINSIDGGMEEKSVISIFINNLLVMFLLLSGVFTMGFTTLLVMAVNVFLISSVVLERILFIYSYEYPSFFIFIVMEIIVYFLSSVFGMTGLILIKSEKTSFLLRKDIFIPLISLLCLLLFFSAFLEHNYIIKLNQVLK